MIVNVNRKLNVLYIPHLLYFPLLNVIYFFLKFNMLQFSVYVQRVCKRIEAAVK